MIEKKYEEYLAAKRVSEEVRHKESLLEAILDKSGILILGARLSRTNFRVYDNELSELVNYFDLWKKFSMTLPGVVTGGSTIGGINSLEYYPANSDKPSISVTGQDEVVKYINSEEYQKLHKNIFEEEDKLHDKDIKPLIIGKDLYLRISRFYLQLQRYSLPKEELKLVKAEMDGMREFIEFYKHRKGKYS